LAVDSTPHRMRLAMARKDFYHACSSSPALDSCLDTVDLNNLRLHWKTRKWCTGEKRSSFREASDGY
jgi:hypothetical protein